ncbi:MAG: ribose-phosphate pyrophosphokinase [Candidatus Marinimicrobia bacterium]|nr:ribose-phosphate pyrophosphokinase [Candidatus Neomarinimicrobiota bacterium]
MDLKIFSGSSNLPLAKKICDSLDMELGKLTLERFSDGEIWCKFEESIRGDDIFIIQSTNSPADNYMELLLLLDAAKRASAGRITAVIPYYGYARQDRKDQPRVPISARLFMDLIVKAGAQRLISMDLHSTQIQGYVDIPFDHLYSRPTFIKYFADNNLLKDDTVIVAPDMGSVPMARSFASKWNKKLAIIDKRRIAHNKAEVMHIIGDVEGKSALLLDDMADTAGTLCAVSETLIQKGAVEINTMFTHPVLSGKAIANIKKSKISKIITTDTIDNPDIYKLDNVEIVSVANTFADAIKRTNRNESISKLFF